MEKRKLSSAGKEIMKKFASKRMKSVELNESWHFMDSVESASMTSYSRSPSCMSHASGSEVGDAAVSSENINQILEPENDDCDKFELAHFDTVEMASQQNDIYDSNCCPFEIGNNEENTTGLLKQLSVEILKVDKSADDSHQSVNDICGVLAYMQLVPPDIRTEIASYMSSGNLEEVQLSEENVHHFYHVASNLNLKQIRDSCFKFCRTMDQTKVLSIFDGCGCKDDIELESSTRYYRSESVVSNPDKSEPPQYYIVFSKQSVSDSKVKNKVKVMVIDMTERRNVYYQEVDKMRQFGNGFACCSCEIKGTPFVYVSGGEGSSQIMKKYDVLLGKWEKCAKLIHGRSHHMMVTSGDGSIFVLGGKEVPCIEEYRMKSNKWTERASLATHVVSAVCIYHQSKIYVFGGRTQAGPVSNVQCYDTETHKISLLQDLPCPFEGGQVVTLNNYIYIATDQGHMICFNPQDGSSFLCTQQPVKRKQFGMFTKNGRIYLVGGAVCSEETICKTIPQYRYNPMKDLWVEKYKLCHNFSVFASCIINYEKKCCVIPFNESF